MNNPIRALIRTSVLALVVLVACVFRVMAQTTVIDDHGNSPGAATAVTLPSTVNGNLEAVRDIDYFKFTLAAPAVVTVTSGGTTDVVGRLLLGGPGNAVTEIYYDNDGAGAPNFRLSQLFPAGTHYVCVHPMVSTTTGAYTVTFTADPPAATQPDVSVNVNGSDFPTGTLLDLGSGPVTGLVTKDVVIGNAGDADLLVRTIRLSLTGSLPSGAAFPFRIVAYPATTVAPGRQTTLRLGFQSTFAGTFNGKATIVTNDGDEIFYDIALRGTAAGTLPAPEIAVRNGTTEVINNGAIAFGSTQANVRLVKDLTIANTGDSELKITSSYISQTATNSLPGAFSFYLGSPPTSVPAGSVATFKVALNALVAGSYTAKLMIINNDSNEGTTTINLSGTVTADPVQGEIGVAVDGTDVQSNNIVAFGNNKTGVTLTKDFVISNTGTADLRLTSWSLGVPTPVTVPVATTTTLGSAVATVVDASKLTVGMGVFGPFTTGTAVAAINGTQVTFTSAATASIAGSILSYVVGGPAATVQAFRFEGALPSTVVAGASTTVKISYLPLSTGDHTSNLTLYNNDADENPFRIVLTGHADANPNPGDIALSLSTADVPMNSDVNFGEVPVNTTTSKLFTVTNTGASELRLTGYGITTVLPAPVTGTTSTSAFFFGGLPSTVIAAGQTATISVSFRPLASGTAYKSQILLYSTDPDESPYKFNVIGTGGTIVTPVPEIAVTQAGVGVPTNGSVSFGITSTNLLVTKPFVIRNTGNGALSLTGVSFLNATGTTGAPFRVDGTLPSSIAAGGSATINVTYAPTAAGDHSATLQIGNNDSDENPYRIVLTGHADYVAAPEIAVLNGTTEVANNGTIDCGSTQASVRAGKDIVIANTGDAELKITSAIIIPTGTTPSGTFGWFTSAPPATIAAGAQVTVKLSVLNLVPGSYTGTLILYNNDANESPTNIKLTATVTPDPVQGEIGIAVGGTDLPSNSTVAYGNSLTGVTTTKDFVISNTSTSELRITSVQLATSPVTYVVQPTTTMLGSPIGTVADGTKLAVGMGLFGPFPSGTSIVAISGNQVTFSSPATASSVAVSVNYVAQGAAATVQGFRFENTAPTIVAAGSSATVRLSFLPSVAGNYSSLLSIYSNDADENPFKLTLTGHADVNPNPGDITLALNGVEVVANSDTDFGAVPINVPVTKNFIVTNTGGSELRLTSYGLTPVLPASTTTALPFTLASGLPSAPIPPGQSATVAVTFRPSVAGTAYKTLISLYSTDPDESPYRFNVVGTGAAATLTPEINVTQNGATVPSNGSVAYGNAMTGAVITKPFVVSNSGTAPLTLTGLSFVNSATTTTNPFRLEGTLPTSVAAGTSVTINVSYAPTTAGDHSVTMQIGNNDSDENPYRITLTGHADVSTTVPDIAVFNGTVEVPQNASFDFGAVARNMSTFKPLTIKNLGTSTLTLTSPAYTTVAPVPAPTISAFSTSSYSASIAPGAVGTVFIAFKPTALATSYSSTLKINCNDPDENPYTITLTGSSLATDGEIGITFNGADLPNNSSLDFGSNVVLGSQIARSITITNSGTVALGLTGYLVNPATGTTGTAGPLPFTYGSTVSSVPPGQSFTIPLNFTPMASGTYNYVYTINNTDTDEGAYKINVTGAAVASATPPDIGVSFGGADLASGGSVSFGAVPINTSVTREFTITNTGTDTLRIGAGYNIAVSPTSASAILISQSIPQSIAPGATGLWKFTFKPTTAGTTYTSKLTIYNTDPDEGVFVINVTGSTAP